jgi:ribulose-phosphate 3-epimerase
MSTIVAPSLLSCDFLNIESELNHFKNFEKTWFHLDIMDGHFVPNLTFGPPIIKMISKKATLPLDAHLMVKNPKFLIDSLVDCKIHNLTFHFEATNDSLELIKYAKKFFPSVGISLRPGTPLGVLSDEILKSINLILIMSVEPGFGGQSFIESTYEKLSDLQIRKQIVNPGLMVQVDGGVSDLNAKKLIHHGASNLVAGSYIFKEGSNSYAKKVESLRS